MDRSGTSEAAPLAALTSSIHGVLGDDLVAIYLHGSYVSGGFDPGVSDLDVVAVTSVEVDDIDLAGLERMHNLFVGRHPDWVDRLEVVYIGRSTLRSFRISTGRLAVISPGEPFHVRDDRVVEWLQIWYVVRETGITLFGPPASAVVPPVAKSEFVAAVAQYADTISRSRLDDDRPGQLAYSVLTMCRALMTIQTEETASKQEAAAWTRRLMPEWASLIDAALRCRLARGTLGFDDAETRAAAATFIALLAARIRPDSP